MKCVFISVLVMTSLHVFAASDDDLCLKKNDKQACIKAGEAAEKDWSKPELFYSKACELGIDDGCLTVARKASERDDLAKAVAFSKKACGRNYQSACYLMSVYLERQGKLVEAKPGFEAVCRKSMNCDALARIAKSAADRQQLLGLCKKDEVWACFAFGLSEHNYGDAKTAIRTLMQTCNKFSNEFSLCARTAGLIEAPADVQALVDDEAACKHWGGEEGYDAARQKQIEAGMARDCKDRRPLAEQLVKKYKDKADVIFKIRQAIRRD